MRLTQQAVEQKARRWATAYDGDKFRIVLRGQPTGNGRRILQMQDRQAEWRDAEDTWLQKSCLMFLMDALLSADITAATLRKVAREVKRGLPVIDERQVVRPIHRSGVAR